MERSRDHIGVTIARMAAAHHGVPADTLPPISESVDPDALEAMIDPGRTAQQSDLHLSFTYASLQVQLRSDETVIVGARRDERDDSDGVPTRR